MAASYSTSDDLLKLTSLRELPKSRYATNLAVTVYPNERRGRKAVFSHVEVYKMVENVAGRMRESGVRPGTVCAYALPTSFESIIYFYALQWIGAIAAPIDPKLPADEFEAAVKKTGAAVLVSPYEGDDEELEEKADSTAKSLGLCGWHIHRTMNTGVQLETHGQLMGSGAAWAGGASDFKIDPDEIALHISSAVAVVPLSHKMLCNSAKSFVGTYGTAISGSTVMAAPLHDIHGILVLISLFYYGGHVVLPGYGGFTPEKFWDMSKKHKVNWLSASEDQVLELYEDVQKSSMSKANMPKLDFIRIAGHTGIATEIVQSMEDTFNTKIFMSYGTPESSGLATSTAESNVHYGSFGSAVRGCSVAVFNADTRQLCPAGSVGEIAVSGISVAQTYLNSTAAAEAAIFTTETTGEDGESVPITWFATGDRGALDADGYLTVHGNSRKLRAAELALMEERRLADEAMASERALLMKKEEEEAALRRAEKEKAEMREMEMEQERARKAEEAAAAAALAATASRAADLDAREKKLRELEALTKAGIPNPEDLDEETANAILRRLEAIEANHRRLQEDLENRNAQELEEMRRRVAEAEEEAARALANSETPDPVKVDVRMEELEAAVMAAAASAESSANNTREAVKAAREVAEATHGANRAQPVDIKPSTGDQGALTKTVRVALDEVEKAMEKHPAVSHAKAFGRKDQRFGAEVFCAIVPKKGARVSEPWLKLFAQSQLPAPMVPKKFYYMKEVPKNMTRRQLSESTLLQDLSAFAGFCETKDVKRPTWVKRGQKNANAIGF